MTIAQLLELVRTNVTAAMEALAAGDIDEAAAALANADVELERLHDLRKKRAA